MEKHFNHEDSQAVDQVSQGDCAVPTFGGFQDLTIQSPEQPVPALQLNLR